MANANGERGMIAVDKMGGKVLFLNPATYETEVVIDGFPRTVHELLVVPETGRAYVPIFGDGIHGRNPNPQHFLCIFDLNKRAHIGTIDTRPYVAPHTLKLGPDGLIYISSRFEGHVHRLTADDRVELYATELGVPTGLAFAPDGTLFVGDRSGSILKVSPERQVETYATLPASVAAFHLSYGPDDCLYVTAPTLATHDPVYRITRERLVDVVCNGFGRPQGLAFDASGALYVADALAGGAGLYRIDLSLERPKPDLVLSAPMLVGVAFDPRGGLVLASNDTIWKLDVDLKPLQSQKA